MAVDTFRAVTFTSIGGSTASRQRFTDILATVRNIREQRETKGHIADAEFELLNNSETLPSVLAPIKMAVLYIGNVHWVAHGSRALRGRHLPVVTPVRQ